MTSNSSASAPIMPAAAGVAHGGRASSAMLRLQTDERLVAHVRRGNQAAFEVLVGRYRVRLLAFCRHMLGAQSRADAEDVLQEVFVSAYRAMLGDERPINVRPWLYRIARNRCLNHLRRTPMQSVEGLELAIVDESMSTVDEVHQRAEIRQLLGDIQELPETQKTAILLREIDDLSYDQIAMAMDTTIPAVKSLLVRARVGLAEAAESRRLSCDDVRLELGQKAEGLVTKLTPATRRHLKDCKTCAAFQIDLKDTNKSLAALAPAAGLLLLGKALFAPFGASGSAGASASGAAVGTAAGAGSTGGVLLGAGSLVSVKAVAGLAAAVAISGAAVEADHVQTRTADVRRQVIAQVSVPPKISPPHKIVTGGAAALAVSAGAVHAARAKAADATDTPQATTPDTTPATPTDTPQATTPDTTPATTAAATSPSTTPPSTSPSGTTPDGIEQRSSTASLPPAVHLPVPLPPSVTRPAAPAPSSPAASSPAPTPAPVETPAPTATPTPAPATSPDVASSPSPTTP
jgi:RNA polymerase sigma factor (sigma-70 family)